MGSHAAFGLRDLDHARRLAEEALAGWNETMPGDLLGRIRFHLGMVTREIGDTAAALAQFEAFLAEVHGRYPELMAAEGKAHFYMALAYRQRGDLEPAVAAYQRAAVAFQQAKQPRLLAKTFQNLAWVFCLLRRPEEARECLTTAAGAMDPADQAHQTVGEAFLAVVDGEPGQARTLCDSLSAVQLTAEEGAEVAWVAASAALAAGDRAGAARLAVIAQRNATEARDARLISDASNLRLRINLQGGLAGA
jgi:tetratricopeptide (TPR) repeat protein